MNKTSFSPPEKFLSHTTSETAQFLFQQAEKRLNETIETDKLITDRCYRLIAILTPTFLTLLAFAVERAEQPDILLIMLMLSIGFVTYSIFEVYRSLFPKPLMLSGSDPEEVFQESLLDNLNDNQIIAACIWECQNYQERISHNRRQNNKRLSVSKKALNTLKAMVIVELATFSLYLIYQLFWNQI